MQLGDPALLRATAGFEHLQLRGDHGQHAGRKVATVLLLVLFPGQVAAVQRQCATPGRPLRKGLPAGWVTAPALKLTHAQQFTALGNGVVPRQAAHALKSLGRSRGNQVR
jgi:hypothetical protein